MVDATASKNGIQMTFSLRSHFTGSASRHDLFLEQQFPGPLCRFHDRLDQGYAHFAVF